MHVKCNDLCTPSRRSIMCRRTFYCIQFDTTLFLLLLAQPPLQLSRCRSSGPKPRCSHNIRFSWPGRPVILSSSWSCQPCSCPHQSSQPHQFQSVLLSTAQSLSVHILHLPQPHHGCSLPGRHSGSSPGSRLTTYSRSLDAPREGQAGPVSFSIALREGQGGSIPIVRTPPPGSS